jgi:hypothetical protein
MLTSPCRITFQTQMVLKWLGIRPEAIAVNTLRVSKYERRNTAAGIADTLFL